MVIRARIADSTSIILLASSNLLQMIVIDDRGLAGEQLCASYIHNVTAKLRQELAI